MKKILMIVGMVSLLWACSGDDDAVAPGGEITLDKTGLSFERTGGQMEVTVTSDGDWRLTGRKTWCRPSVVAGKNGDKVVFEADENTGDETRAITYTFMCGGKAVDFIVTQSKTNGIELIRPEESIGPEGGVVTVRLRTNVDLEISIPEEAKEWIAPLESEPQAVSGAEYVYLKFEVTENKTYGDRDVEVALSGGGETERVTILQTKNLGLMVDPESTEIPESGDEIEIEVSANVDFEIEMSALTQTFVTKTGETTRTEGNLTVTAFTFSVAQNDVMTRNAVITFRSEQSGLNKKVTLNQTGSHALVVKIPDANFRRKLLQNKCIKDDSAEDCELTWEGLSTTNLSIGYSNIASLEGLEAFIGLESFDISSSRLERIDVSKNVNLKRLSCNLNGIKELILGETRVETINLKDGLYYTDANGEYIKPVATKVSGLYLKSLDISMRSWYDTYDDLETLDVSGCPSLETLNCIRTGEKLKTLILAEGQEIDNLSKSEFTQIVRR